MSTNAARISTYTNASTSSDDRRKSSENAKPDLWSSMLDSVASGKRLPEKNLLVLGASTELQRDFLESLTSDTTSKTQDHSRKQAPIANHFALGYTYHDVLDADHEDILARLSLYLLTEPSPAFAPLLKSLLTPQSIPNTLVVILLDWSEPWFWLRQLRDWVRLLRTLLSSLNVECKDKLAENMESWRDRGRGTSGLDGATSTTTDSEVILPVGPGEWDEGLGLPLCVVCQNSDKIELLEREQGWKEEEFDFILQYLRTVLLKHGSSIIYTTQSSASTLQALIHSSLDIKSLMKRDTLKANWVDRDKIFIPTNWDNWTKIRVHREGFDVDGISQAWSVDIDVPHPTDSSSTSPEPREVADPEDAAVSIYESTISDPALASAAGPSTRRDSTAMQVANIDTQAFLAEELAHLERLRQSDESSSNQRATQKGSATLVEFSSESTAVAEGRVSEHIGPVQFNMGGIQVDADDMLQRLKARQIEAESSAPTSPADDKTQHEALANFFQGLMKRGQASGAGSPKAPPRG